MRRTCYVYAILLLLSAVIPARGEDATTGLLPLGLSAGDNQEFTMAQTSKAASEERNPNVVPMGPGGLPGHLFRMIVMICTGGFVYPNTFVEGMDLTALQKTHQGPTDRKA